MTRKKAKSGQGKHPEQSKDFVHFVIHYTAQAIGQPCDICGGETAERKPRLTRAKDAPSAAEREPANPRPGRRIA